MSLNGFRIEGFMEGQEKKWPLEEESTTLDMNALKHPGKTPKFAPVSWEERGRYTGD